MLQLFFSAFDFRSVVKGIVVNIVLVGNQLERSAVIYFHRSQGQFVFRVKFQQLLQCEGLFGNHGAGIDHIEFTVCHLRFQLCQLRARHLSLFYHVATTVVYGTVVFK